MGEQLPDGDSPRNDDRCDEMWLGYEFRVRDIGVTVRLLGIRLRVRVRVRVREMGNAIVR